MTPPNYYYLLKPPNHARLSVGVAFWKFWKSYTIWPLTPWGRVTWRGHYWLLLMFEYELLSHFQVVNLLDPCDPIFWTHHCLRESKGFRDWPLWARLIKSKWEEILEKQTMLTERRKIRSIYQKNTKATAALAGYEIHHSSTYS